MTLIEFRFLCDLRRFFATALGKADLAALLRSPSASVQLAALRASNALAQHVETLPSASLPWIVRLLQGPDGMFAQQQHPKECCPNILFAMDS
jgi:hypothetical protein